MRTLRESALALLAIDGADRDLPYDLLRSGEMPELAALVGLPLGRRPGEASRALFERLVDECLCSRTPGWPRGIALAGRAALRRR